jgi:hypothetical protein
MSSLKSNIQIAPQEIFQFTSTQGTDLGALATTGDGRYFRYAKVGATALVAGKVYQGPANDVTNWNPAGGLAIGQANATGSFGPMTISTSTTLAVNALQGGLMAVAVTPGQGFTYKIKGNSVTAGATGCAITLEDPLQTNLSTASRVVVYPNKFNGIVVLNAAATGPVVGVAVNNATEAYFTWIQTQGLAATLIGATGGVGVPFGWMGIATGAFAPVTGATWPTYAFSVATANYAEYDILDLHID